MNESLTSSPVVHGNDLPFLFLLFLLFHLFSSFPSFPSFPFISFHFLFSFHFLLTSFAFNSPSKIRICLCSHAQMQQSCSTGESNRSFFNLSSIFPQSFHNLSSIFSSNFGPFSLCQGEVHGGCPFQSFISNVLSSFLTFPRFSFQIFGDRMKLSDWLH